MSATVVTGIVLLAIAGVLLAIAIWSLSWPSVKGRIEVSFLEADPGTPIQVQAAGLEMSRRPEESHHLAYSYEVKGARYMGGDIKPLLNLGWAVRSGGRNGSIMWSAARDDARWYRPDAVVDVYYCPMAPSWACLEPGGFVTPALLVAGAIIVFIAGK